MKNPWVIIGVLAVILIGGSVWYSSQVNKSYNEGVVIKDHFLGGENASVTLTEYSDFQCPACKQFHPYVKAITEEYGDSLRFEYRHFPLMQLHPYAEAAARAAEAAGQQDKFFEFHDLLFENQDTWAKSNNPGAYFADYAEELGLDMRQFTRQQRSSVLRDHIRDQFDEARAQGLTGTPSFFLNGVRMEITTYDDFKNQIEAALGVTPPATETGTSTVEFGI